MPGASRCRPRLRAADRLESHSAFRDASTPGVTTRRKELGEPLKPHQGNVAAVARELQKPRSYVYRWLRTYGLRATLTARCAYRR
jgi:transcriptional regulator of acetoin/glycerol metabolism